MKTSEELTGWFTGRIPDDWFVEAPEVTYDREEILVVGRIKEPEAASESNDAAAAARDGRARQFREDTRGQRMKIADEAEHRFGRKVSWGVQIADERKLFTTASVPVMTRLRMADREVLDALVDAGVARSRSDALAWCVRLVARNEKEWIGQLKDALAHVEKARDAGPESASR